MKMRTFAILLGLFLAPFSAMAQPCPPASTPNFTAAGNVFGRIASQWNSYFASKVDANGGTLCNVTIQGLIGLTYQEIVTALGYVPLNPANNLSDITTPVTARTNLGLAIGTNVEAWSANLDAFSAKTAPTGAVVGTTDTQTLTNKTLDASTITNTPISGSTGSFSTLSASQGVTGNAQGHVATLAALQGSCFSATGCTLGAGGGIFSDANRTVRRDDYSAGFGAPPLDFKGETGTCAANGRIGATLATSSISGTTLTVGSVSAGALAIGQYIDGVAAGTQITAGSGSSWTVSVSQTVASQTLNTSDHGSCVNTTSGDGNSFYAIFPAGGEDVREFGADPTGTNDSTFAIAATLNSFGTRSGMIRLPAGSYKLNSQLAFTFTGITSAGGLARQRISIVGDGEDATILDWPNPSGGISFTMSSQQHSFLLRDLSIVTSVAGGGTGLSAINSTGYVNAVQFDQNTLEDVAFRGLDGPPTDLNHAGNPVGSDYWNTNLLTSGVSNVNLINVSISGEKTATLSTGWLFEGQGTDYSIIVNAQQSQFNFLGSGVVYGNYVQGATFNQCNFNGNNTNIYSNISAGVSAQLTIVGSQFGLFGGAQGISIAGAVNNLILADNLFYIPNVASPSSAQAFFLANTFYAQIHDNQFIGSGGTGSGGGTVINSNSAPLDIHDNQFKDLSAGISWGGSVGDAITHDNSYISVTTPVLNLSSAATNQIKDNPLGTTSVTPGASPWTYTAGPRPETLYLSGGVVSAIAVGGNTVASASPAVVKLNPNESVTITYSAAPTAVTDRQ